MSSLFHYGVHPHAAGIPGVAAAAAVVDALRAMGVTRVSVASPYEPWLNDKLAEYLKAFGIEVLALKGLGTQAHAGAECRIG